MHYDYNPKSDYEKFAMQIYNLLSTQFSQTYFVGGMVRDLLLHRNITDIDLATEARPEQIASILQTNQIEFNEQGQQFGVTTAEQGNFRVEIATFRDEEYGESRFPKVRFLDGPEQDSQRRDFTINALYLSPRQSEILDFHGGLNDLESKTIKFIGDEQQKIADDPLRIVRAFRFQISLEFNFEPETEQLLNNSLHLLKNVSAQRIDAEINKISNNIVRQKLRKVIHKNT